MTYFMLGICVILAYLLASMLFGFILGIIEYFRIRVGVKEGVNTRSIFKRGIVCDILLELFTNIFYNRILVVVFSIVFYPLKAWSRNIVYNHFFKNDFKMNIFIDKKVKFYALKNDRFKNGFYVMPRSNKDSVSNSYKSKNMIVGYRNDLMSHILFPIAFMIWLYNNDDNPYDMSAHPVDHRDIKNKQKYKFIPEFLHKYLKDIGKDRGSYLQVGDNLIKEPAYVSFIIDSLFISGCTDINIRFFYDN